MRNSYRILVAIISCLTTQLSAAAAQEAQCDYPLISASRLSELPSKWYAEDNVYEVNKSQKENRREFSVVGDILVINKQTIPSLSRTLGSYITNVDSLEFVAREIVLDMPLRIESTQLSFIAEKVSFSSKGLIDVAQDTDQAFSDISIIAKEIDLKNAPALAFNFSTRDWSSIQKNESEKTGAKVVIRAAVPLKFNGSAKNDPIRSVHNLSLDYGPSAIANSIENPNGWAKNYDVDTRSDRYEQSLYSNEVWANFIVSKLERLLVLDPYSSETQTIILSIADKYHSVFTKFEHASAISRIEMLAYKVRLGLNTHGFTKYELPLSNFKSVLSEFHEQIELAFVTNGGLYSSWTKLYLEALDNGSLLESVEKQVNSLRKDNIELASKYTQTKNKLGNKFVQISKVQGAMDQLFVKANYRKDDLERKHRKEVQEAEELNKIIETSTTVLSVAASAYGVPPSVGTAIVATGTGANLYAKDRAGKEVDFSTVVTTFSEMQKKHEEITGAVDSIKNDFKNFELNLKATSSDLKKPGPISRAFLHGKNERKCGAAVPTQNERKNKEVSSNKKTTKPKISRVVSGNKDKDTASKRENKDKKDNATNTQASKNKQEEPRAYGIKGVYSSGNCLYGSVETLYKKYNPASYSGISVDDYLARDEKLKSLLDEIALLASEQSKLQMETTFLATEIQEISAHQLNNAVTIKTLSTLDLKNDYALSTLRQIATSFRMERLDRLNSYIEALERSYYYYFDAKPGYHNSANGDIDMLSELKLMVEKYRSGLDANEFFSEKIVSDSDISEDVESRLNDETDRLLTYYQTVHTLLAEGFDDEKKLKGFIADNAWLWSVSDEIDYSEVNQKKYFLRSINELISKEADATVRLPISFPKTVSGSSREIGMAAFVSMVEFEPILIDELREEQIELAVIQPRWGQVSANGHCSLVVDALPYKGVGSKINFEPNIVSLNFDSLGGEVSVNDAMNVYGARVRDLSRAIPFITDYQLRVRVSNPELWKKHNVFPQIRNISLTFVRSAL